jgi:subtilisin-like proprotein convertase family protein
LTPCTDYTFFVESADAAGNVTVDDNGGSYHSFATGLDVEPTYVSDRSETIRDNRNAVSTLEVADDEVVLDVNVTVNITHTYLGDVEIYLMGPNGVEIDLSSDNGGAATAYTGTTFDDEADLSILEGLAPYAGSFRPEQPLSAFDGIQAAGEWSLRVFDDADGNTGTLDSWSLQLLYPAQPCGPQAAYDSHALSADICAPGEPGHADGVGDAGEEVSFLVTLRNDGTDPVTGITGTVMSLTSGVLVTGGASAFPDLMPGGTVTSLAPFSARVSSTIPCGMPADFRIDISAVQGTWTSKFPQAVGLPLPGGGTVLEEDFDGGIPAPWTILDGGTSSDTWFADDPGDPLACGSTDPAPPIGGAWAAVDSDCAQEVEMDESLVTPILDLGPATTAAVEFDHYFNRYEAEVADLDIRSSLTGGAWITVGTWIADTANPQHEWVDITLQAAGASDVQLRWRYHNANFEWYWYVDNVRVSYTSLDDCQMTVCTAVGPPPGEQTGAGWADTDTYTWNVDPMSTGGYLVYRGTGTQLQALVDGLTDSCLRSSVVTAVIDLTGDDPGNTGEFRWYLVTGWNDAGEGTAGSGTVTPRLLNTTGPCGP